MQLQPWRHPIKVETKDGECLLVSPRPTDADDDPSRYDLIPTDTLKIGGRDFTRKPIHQSAALAHHCLRLNARKLLIFDGNTGCATSMRRSRP
jgi:hypothetical protein